MFWAARQLLTPCNYLRIRHGDSVLQSKAVYDFVLPAALTIVTGAVFFWIKAPWSIFKDHALFSSVSSLLAILIGFYMAALAAVSTFHREGIDDPLKGGDATLAIRHHDGGHRVQKKLSYRQFISYLFGYMAFLSFLIYVALLILSNTWPQFSAAVHKYYIWDNIFDWVVEPTTFFVIFFAMWQLFVTSLLGIYFLADRIQSLTDPEN